MLVLLPPSETKAPGGDGAPLRPAELALPELTDVREMLLGELIGLSADPEAALTALKLRPTMLAEVERNAALATAPTMRALARYTGVLFDAIDVAALTADPWAHAGDRVMIGSALFGAVAADDPIPAYRLSAGSRLPGHGTLARLWKPVLTPALAAEADRRGGLTIDLRSGAYLGLGPVPGAVTVTVQSVQPDGTRTVVSHFNKHYKGVLAGALIRADDAPQDLAALAALAATAGLEPEISGETELTLVVR